MPFQHNYFAINFNTVTNSKAQPIGSRRFVPLSDHPFHFFVPFSSSSSSSSSRENHRFIPYLVQDDEYEKLDQIFWEPERR